MWLFLVFPCFRVSGVVRERHLTHIRSRLSFSLGTQTLSLTTSSSSSIRNFLRGGRGMMAANFKSHRRSHGTSRPQGLSLKREVLWRLIPKMTFRISVSSETQKLRFHLVLETTSEHFGNSVSRILRKLGIHPIPAWPRNPSEIRFPWFLGFLGNSEFQTWKLILFLFLITRPLIFYS